MILLPHASLVRVETIRLMLAMGKSKQDIAEAFGITPQGVHAAVNRFDLEQPLKPFGLGVINATPFLKVAVQPQMREKIVQAKIIERLFGYS